MCTGGGKEREEEGKGGTKGREIEEGRIEWKGERMEAPLGKTIRTAFPSYVINATPSRDLLAECCAAKICNLLPRQGCDLSTRRIAFSSDREISETLLSITMPLPPFLEARKLPPRNGRISPVSCLLAHPVIRHLSTPFKSATINSRSAARREREEEWRRNSGSRVANSEPRVNQCERLFEHRPCSEVN